MYTAPFIWIPADKLENHYIKVKKDESKKIYKDQWSSYDKFYVEAISYDDDGAINGVSIKNSNTHKRVFVYDNTKKEKNNG